jgi:hypothetical protein
MKLRPLRLIAAAGVASALSAVTVLVAVAKPAAPSCPGAVVTDVRHGLPVCIHPSERPPPGVDLHRTPSATQLLERRFGLNKRPPAVAGTEPGATTAATGSSIACVGDGVEGDRVQAIYARASDKPDRSSSVVSLIRQYAADADYQVNISAGQSGQGRRVRYVTQDCALSVATVTLSAAGDDTFTAMRSELEAKGFDRPDRKYLVWVDASVGICGLGELYLDDRTSASNANNSGPMYARVDAPCWGYAESHELLHTLGAVQASAPHSTGAGHCVDENDTMCYSDTSGAAMSNACPSMPTWQVDCALDDYFNASPSPTSYLSTHWNVANSTFLEGAPAPPPPPTISLSAPSSFYAGNAVSMRAYPGVPAGRTYSVLWSSSRTDCKFYSGSGVTNAVYCPVTSAGSGQITARVVDSLGMSSSVSRTYTLLTPSRPRRTLASVTSRLTSLLRGRSTTLTGKLLDYYTRKAVIGMRVSIYYRREGSRSWSRLTTRYTGRTGTFSLTVRPSRTTTYMIVSWSTRTWASDQSNTRRISVR